jgi:hypothetical protein
LIIVTIRNEKKERMWWRKGLRESERFYFVFFMARDRFDWIWYLRGGYQENFTIMIQFGERVRREYLRGRFLNALFALIL